jgi:uncharacterized metal-binding protein YceD (DUF177 family)
MDKKPEFSFFIKCKTLKEAEKTFHVEANNEEREKLAKRLDLLNLESLRVKAVVFRQSTDLVQALCECRADYSQACVATSKPLKKNLNFDFVRLFSANTEVYFGCDVEPDEEGGGVNQEIPDPPDPMIDGGFDLGESVAEQLSLEIDPFPRAADAVIDYSASTWEAASKQRPNPFAILEQLRKK